MAVASVVVLPPTFMSMHTADRRPLKHCNECFVLSRHLLYLLQWMLVMTAISNEESLGWMYDYVLLLDGKGYECPLGPVFEGPAVRRVHRRECWWQDDD